MRGFVFLLVLANLLFFAWSQGYFGAPVSNDADRAAQQLNPEKLRVVARGDAPPAPASPPPPTPKAETCLRWAGLSVADAVTLAALITQNSPAARIERQETSSHASWWTFMPLKSRPDAERKAGELKAIGVTDFFIVQDPGPYRWSISLGIYSSEEAASAALEALRAKGVRSAKVGPKGEPAPVVELNVHAPSGEVAALRALSSVAAEECAAPPAVAAPSSAGQ